MRLVIHTTSLRASTIIDGLTRSEAEGVLASWTQGKILGVPADWGAMYFHPTHVVRLDVIGDD